MTAFVEVHGLEVFGRHGVNEDERGEGQTFVFDVTVEVEEPLVDEIHAAVDYRAVRDVVRAVSNSQSYALLETLAAAVADALISTLAVHGVRVRVRKPGIAWAEWAAATVERRADAI